MHLIIGCKKQRAFFPRRADDEKQFVPGSGRGEKGKILAEEDEKMQRAVTKEEEEREFQWVLQGLCSFS